MSIITFGKFEVTQGESDNPKDLEIKVIGFDFDDDTSKDDFLLRNRVLAILDYIKEQLQ
jgi:hypothetical protein